MVLFDFSTYLSKTKIPKKIFFIIGGVSVQLKIQKFFFRLFLVVSLKLGSIYQLIINCPIWMNYAYLILFPRVGIRRQPSVGPVIFVLAFVLLLAQVSRPVIQSCLPSRLISLSTSVRQIGVMNVVCPIDICLRQKSQGLGIFYSCRIQR